MPFFLREIMAYIEDDSTSDNSIWKENFFENINSHTSIWRALVFVGLMLFTLFFARILRENLAFMQLKIGVQANQALTGMIYNKILRVSSATNKFYKKGDIISYIQVDSPKVTFLFDTLPEVSRIPFLLVFLVISLYMFIGMTFLAAIGVVVVFGILNYYIAKWTAMIQIDRMKKLDKRTNKISEVIDNIKLIKFNSWVEKFLDKVFKARSKEIKVIIKKLLMWTINITVMNLNYPVLAISVFLIAIFGVKLSVAVPTALAILQILNSLHSSSYSLPLFIGDFVEFMVSMKRIQSFLKCDEIEENTIIHDKRAFDDTSITVSNCNFFWGFDEKIKKKKKLTLEEEDKKDEEDAKEDLEIQNKNKKINSSSDTSSSDSEESDESENSDDEEDSHHKFSIKDKITLKDIDLEIQRGEFVAIIGEIGSGKTSILSSLIGDMLAVDYKTMEKYKNFKIFDPRHETNADNVERLLELNQDVYRNFNQSRSQALLKPSIHIKGTMSLMEQTPWVLNATIRENILFGEPLDEATYNRTIEI